jgi:hypothetical protein
MVAARHTVADEKLGHGIAASPHDLKQYCSHKTPKHDIHIRILQACTEERAARAPP